MAVRSTNHRTSKTRRNLKQYAENEEEKKKIKPATLGGERERERELVQKKKNYKNYKNYKN